MPSSQTKRIKTLHDQLFSDPEVDLYAVLDGASLLNITSLLAKYRAEHVCLFRGELDPEVAQTAPYLVRVPIHSPLSEWIISGWGNHWGIFATTKAGFRTIRSHFRSFLMVYDPNRKPLYFRYYDPRVMRIYLPTCNSEESASLFGPVLSYYMEGADSNQLLRFLPNVIPPQATSIPLDVSPR